MSDDPSQRPSSGDNAKPLPQRGCDVCVRGDGVVGHVLALALAAAKLRVELQVGGGRRVGEGDGVGVDGDSGRVAAAAQPVDDVRAFALNAASVTLLRGLGVWDVLPHDARTPLHDMQVHGDARGSVLTFSAWQQQVDALGWIVDAQALEAALADAVQAGTLGPDALITHGDGEDGDSGGNAGVAHRRPMHGTLPSPTRCALLAVAEGASSPTRDRLGVAFDRRPYGQHAVAARLTSTHAHLNTARQWFLSPDILALLPFDRPAHDHGYALVWSVPSARAQALMAMDAGDFEQALNETVQGLRDGESAAPTPTPTPTRDAVGRLSLASSRASWPLSVGAAERVFGPGWVLLGDAAHGVHPLAGQGLNLGLADVAALVSVLAERETWRPLGDARLLARYARQRALSVGAMTATTDTLHWLFAHPSRAARELRNIGMNLVDHAPPLKRRLARQALES